MMFTFMTTSPVVSAATLSEIEKKRSATNEMIKKLKSKERAEKSKLVKNQKNLEKVSANLKSSQKQYTNLESQLKKMEKQYTTSVAEYNVKSVHMREHIRKVYKHQRRGMFELLFLAQDLNGLLDVIYFEKIILKKDYERMQAIKTKAEGIQKLKAEIESKKKVLAGTIKTINAQQKNIQTEIAKNQDLINKLKTDRSVYEKAERELARQSENLATMISRNSGVASVATASAGFLKPINGRITSPFGWRTHPIFNSRSFHSGVDIGGPNYGNIVASNSGKVIYSGWYGGYGKVVILDHGTVNGKPTTTLYAHMSSILVNNGQKVNKGQVIGKEGTTGYSTGPHCHFEVRIDGKPNNPLNYI